MKKRSGMTLLEIIVSMAIFAVIAMLVVQIMSSVNAMMRSTSQLNDRLAYEAKYADNLQVQTGSAGVGVDYIIRYDIRSNGGAKEINSSGSTHQAMEYTVEYDKTVNVGDEEIYLGKKIDGVNKKVQGEDLHKNVNYRFMTFKKVNMTQPLYPGETFYLALKPVAYFSGTYYGNDASMAEQFASNMTEEQIEAAETQAASLLSGYKKIQAVIVDDSGAPRSEGNGIETFTDPEGSVERTIFSSGTLQLNQEYSIPVTNCPKELADDVMEQHGRIYFEVSKDFELSTTETRKFADSIVTYYKYSKIGSASSSFKNATFYKSCTIEFNVRTGAFNVLESIPADS